MRKKIQLLLILLLVSICFVVIQIPDNKLHIIACNVGQGDAILIMQGSRQILIDGGPDNWVMKCLEDHLAFWDRQIELVINTHPQKDHYLGLIDVFGAYKVDYLLISGLESSSPEYRVLQSLVGGSSTEVLYADTSRSIGLGLMHLDILHPTGSFIKSLQPSQDPNYASVVALLHFGDFEALFTGDLDSGNSDKLAVEFRDKLKNIEYLKVPHHGSKNGLSKSMLDITNPIISIISVGKDNSYGQPSYEVLKMLQDVGTRVYRTDRDSSIEIVSTGKEFWVKR